MKNISYMTKDEQLEAVFSFLPCIKNLLETTKIDIQEKMSVLEDVNIDLIAYLQSIGEYL